MHYAPIRETLQGEPPEIFPFLGSYLLAEAVDRSGADLVIHGHAHRGTEHGVTPGGVNVRNVAQTVIRQAYAVYGFETATHRREPATVRSSRSRSRS
jgi:Icc-related predicted phosphoesterase